MEVTGCADWPREDDARRVDALPDTVEVADSGDFLNEHRRQTLASELLVHNKEVDFGAEDGLLADSDMCGDGRDVRDELAGLGGSDTNVVPLLPTGRHHCPDYC